MFNRVGGVNQISRANEARMRLGSSLPRAFTTDDIPQINRVTTSVHTLGSNGIARSTTYPLSSPLTLVQIADNLTRAPRPLHMNSRNLLECSDFLMRNMSSDVAEQFWEGFQLGSAQAKDLFPTKKTNDGVPLSQGLINEFESRLDLQAAHRFLTDFVLAKFSLKAFGIEVLAHNSIDQNVPKWLNATQGKDDRKLLFQMIESLSSLGNPLFARNLCNTAIILLDRHGLVNSTARFRGLLTRVNERFLALRDRPAIPIRRDLPPPPPPPPTGEATGLASDSDEEAVSSIHYPQRVSAREMRRLAVMDRAETEIFTSGIHSTADEFGVVTLCSQKTDSLIGNYRFVYKDDHLLGFYNIRDKAMTATVGSHKYLAAENEHYLLLRLKSPSQSSHTEQAEEEIERKNRWTLVNHAFDKLKGLKFVIPSYFISSNMIIMKNAGDTNGREMHERNETVDIRSFIKVLKEIEQCYDKNVLLVDMNPGNFIVNSENGEEEIFLIDTDTLYDLDYPLICGKSGFIPLAKSYTPESLTEKILSIPDDDILLKKEWIIKSNTYSLLATMYEMTTGLPKPIMALTDEELDAFGFIPPNNLNPTEKYSFLSWVNKCFKPEYVDSIKAFILDPVNNYLGSLSDMIA